MGKGSGKGAEGVVDEITKLNDRVESIVKDATNPRYKDFQNEIQMVKEGKIIYVNRFTAIVYLIGAVGVCAIFQAMSVLPAMCSISIAVFMFVWSDFYSAVLHVVLDHPESMRVPIIDQPSLEFQWHHLIPDDIARKPYAEACGDLNVAVVISVGLFSLCSSMDPLYRILIGWKLINGYIGQWSHRMAHTAKAKRPAWTIKLQEMKLLLPAKDHMVHHNTYNDNFAILNGSAQGIVAKMRTITEDNKAWTAFFAFISVTDVFVLHNIFEAIFL